MKIIQCDMMKEITLTIQCYIHKLVKIHNTNKHRRFVYSQKPLHMVVLTKYILLTKRDLCIYKIHKSFCTW